MNIALTPGEPAGIGPDLCLALAQKPRKHRWVVVADKHMLTARAGQLGLKVKLLDHDDTQPAATDAGVLSVLHVPCPNPVTAGQLDAGNARYVIDTLTIAADGCMAGRFAGVVTAPVHKGVINDAGIAFSGHTEFFAERTGGNTPVMLLHTKQLRVALATTHMPLRAVPDAITSETLDTVISILRDDLITRFGIKTPRIAVCGLNPHAGEQGHLGREELDVIIPQLERMRAQGFDLIGPLPADTAFTPPALAACDAVLAMYHDQGLTALKALGFGEAVNVTLGLPIIRTSVDHGTALTLAGTGQAQSSSLNTAIDLAAELIAARAKQATQQDAQT